MTRLSDVLGIVNGKAVCVVNGERNVFVSKDELVDSSFCNYVVTSICAENDAIVMNLKPWQPPVTDMDADWVKSYKEGTGTEPSFF